MEQSVISPPQDACAVAVISGAPEVFIARRVQSVAQTQKGSFHYRVLHYPPPAL
jgi:hypothetical protein